MMIRPRLLLACAFLFVLGGGRSSTQAPSPNPDVNRDGIVDTTDLAIVQANLGNRCNQAGFDPRADVNGDCVVNVTDVAIVSRNLGQRFPPTITASVSPPPNANNWHRTPVTITYACSGTTSCPSAAMVSTEGAGQVIDRTVSNAGGSATAHTVLNIDLTPPAASIQANPAPNADGWNTSPVTVKFICTDLLSGIATCPDDQVITAEGDGQTVHGNITDRAGNSISVTSLPFRIDFHVPKVSRVEPAQLTVAAGGGVGALTIFLDAPDPLRDIHIALTSGNQGIAGIPEGLILPAGAMTGVITVTGGVPGGPVPITASLNGSSATSEITVVERPPAPTLAVPLVEGMTIVTGVGLAGAVVGVQVDAGAMVTGPVGSDGHFAVPVVPLVAGQSVRASQTVSGLTSPLSAPVIVQARPPAPTVNSPLIAGGTQVQGTGASGALIEVFVNGVSAATGLAAEAGTFTIPVPVLVAGQQIAATQTVTGVTSIPSAAVTVVAAPAPPSITSPLVAGSVSVTGLATPTATVETFVDGSSVGSAGVSGNGAWTLAVSNPLVVGQHVKARQTVGGIASAFSAELVVVARPPAPVINTPLVDGSVSVGGTGVANASIALFINAVAAGLTSVGANGAWTLGLTAPLTVGQVVTAIQTAGGIDSDPSLPTTVIARPPAPTVTGPLIAGGTSVPGTGVAGATVALFVGGSPAGTATVNPSGLWTVLLGTALVAGQQVTANQTVAGVTSGPSAPLTVFAQSPAPIINGPLFAGGLTVGGTGIAAASLEVFANGISLGTTAVGGDGTWALPLASALIAGQVITAQQIVGGIPSALSAPVTVLNPSQTPVLTSATPNSGRQNQNNLSVALTGQFTHFSQQNTAVNFGSGITVGVVTVTDATHLTAQLAIDPTAAVGPRTITVTSGAEVASLANGFTVTVGTPAITQVSPNAGQQGTQSLVVNIAGQFSHWAQGSTIASFGAGVTVTSLTVNTATAATAVVNIDPAAAIGARDVTTTSGTEAIKVAGAFVITHLPSPPILVSIKPDTGRQGQAHLSVAITGRNTHFTGASAIDLESGISPGNVVATDSTHLGAELTIASNAATGARNLTVTSGSEVVVLSNTVSPVPTAVGPSPYLSFDDSPFRGINFDYFFLENFEDGLLNTPGVTKVGGSILQRSDQFSDSVDGDDGVIDNNGNAGGATTGALYSLGVAALEFTFAPAALGGKLPTHVGLVVTDASPSSNMTLSAFRGGQLLGVVTGFQVFEGLHFTEQDRFYGFIDIGGIDRVVIAAATSTDWAMDHLQYGAANPSGAFTVTAGPALISASPSVGQQGQTNIIVTLVGTNTNFMNSSVIDVGAGVTASSVVAIDATHLQAQFAVAPNASPGARTLTVTTGTEVATLLGGFTVQPGAPILTGLSQPSGQQGQQSLSLTITGRFTHWAQGGTTASFGPGITVTSLAVTSPASATALVTIAPAAALGLRTVTITTGAEVVSLANGFTVTPGTSVITQVTPNTGQQGQQSLSVAITGQFTHFVQGTTTANFGNGIAVATLTVNSSTAATAVISIDPVAALGLRNVVLATAAETASLANGFTVNATPNLPPIVSAGPNQTITLPSSAALNGTIADDGLPLGSQLTGSWSVLTAPTTTGQTWIKTNPSGTVPTPFPVGTSVLFDPHTNSLIGFGGTTSPTSNATGEVWILSGANGLNANPSWTTLQTTGNGPARYDSSAVYDPGSNRMIVFGGIGPSYPHTNNDVWILTHANGTGGTPAWVQMTPVGSPPVARFGAGAVYDSATNRMIVVGGSIWAASGTYYFDTNQTWILTNANGTEPTPSTWISVTSAGGVPPGRTEPSVAYDAASNRLILFGGLLTYTPAGTFINQTLNDTWVLTDANSLSGQSTWIQLTPDGASTSPARRITSLMGYNAANNTLTVGLGANCLTGPPASCSNLFDAWSLRNANGLGGLSTWTQLAPTGGPPNPVSTGSAYDVASDRLIGFSRPLNETWILTDATNSTAATVTFSNPTSVSPNVAGQVLHADTSAAFSAPGSYVLRLTGTDSQLSTSSDVTVTVQPASTAPRLTAVVPSQSQQGQFGLAVTITGQNTHFVQGTTTASFGAGVTVTSLTVNSATNATAVISIDPAAVVGPRTVTVMTGPEVVALPNGFTVTAGVPVITNVTPNTGQQGQQNLSVAIAGQFTHWVQGTTIASFGPGITVASLIVNSSTTATAVIIIGPAAALGPRTVIITTGSELASLANGFTVDPVPNRAPVVNAGPNQSISLPDSATLFGTVSDDGLPLGTLTVAWSKVSGPGTSTFSRPGEAVTAVSFSENGTYVLRLQATDGLLTASSDVTITADPCLTGKEPGIRLAAMAPGDFIQLPDGRLRMYTGTYSDVSPVKLVSFVSSDGLNWSPEASVQFSPTGGVQGVAFVRVIRLNDGSYRMYFQGDYDQGIPEYEWRIYSAVSVDGLVWTQEPGIRIDRGGPNNCVNLGTPEIVRLAGGSLRMFYTCSPFLATTGGSIYSATSADGLNWIPDPGVRLTPTAAFTGGLEHPQVLKLPDASYRMYYSAFAANTAQELSATSSDLLNWTPEPGARLALGPSGSLDERSVTYARFVPLPDSTYRAYYYGVGSSGSMFSARWCSIGTNNPPTVNAGADQTVPLVTGIVTLAAIATDDGLPAGGTLTYQWRAMSGPGSVTFSSPSTSSTTAQFGTPGGYVLRVIVGDGQLFTYDDVNVTVTSPTAPSIVSVSPSAVIQGGSVSVTVTGQNTHFTDGTTSIGVGPDVTVSSVTVLNNTTLTAQLSVAATAATGQRVLTVTTGGEVIVWSGFAINTAPRLVAVAPATVSQGQVVDITLTGLGTHFNQGSTLVNVGSGVVVGSVLVESATSLTAHLTVDPAAIIGTRTITAITGSEVAVLVSGLAVDASAGASLLSVAPTSGSQGGSGPVAIVGLNTHFIQGTTQLDMGPGIAIGAISVTCPTCLTAQVTVADDAPTGPHTITVTTGPEIAILTNGFAVQAGTPILTSLSKASGQQGQTFAVTITGRFTHFSQGTTQVTLGAGVSVSNIVVTSPTSLSGQVSIDPTAAPGVRTLTVTTGSEVASATNVFTVTSAPTLTHIDITPAGTVTLTKGQTFQFSARGTFSDTTVQDPLSGVTWTSDALTVASVSTTGLATGVGAGTAHIGASKSGIVAVPTSFVVKPLPIGLFGPITAGSTSVDGAVAEPGATVRVSVNGLPRGPTTIANAGGLWTVSGLVPALVVGDSITAAQTVNGVTSDVSNPIIVTPGVPALLSINPNTGTQGQQNLTVTITGQNTHFTQGVSQVSFAGTAVTVNSVTVASATSLTANISLASNALSAPRTVTVTTGAEAVSLANAFVVQPATNQAPTIAIAPTWSVTLPNRLILNYTVADDGLPAGGALTVTWNGVSGPGTFGFLNQTLTSVSAGFSQAGTYVLRITATDTQFTVHQDVTVTVTGTAPPGPTGSITTPADGAEVTAPLTVVGSVGSAALASWALEFRMQNEPAFRTLATGTAPVANGTLGTLDPTLLLNGLGLLQLRATDTFGQTTTIGPVSVVITQNQKIGNFTVSFNDLTVPVAGIPIQVVRTYDSRNRVSGDFGFGWTLDVKAVTLATNGVLGDNWTGTAAGIIRTYCIQPTVSHVVTITFGDGTVYQFQPTLTPGCQQIVPPEQVTMGFTPISTTPPNASLAVVGANDPFVSGPFPGALQLLGSDDVTVFDPDLYRLTLPDGRAFVISRQTGLQTMTDLNGNTLTVTSAGITHSSGRSVTFTRDASNRITQVTDPAGKSILYAYDGHGDLTTVTDRVNNTTSFTYNATHGLLTIVDPRGVQPIKNVYDDSGRLIQHIDAFGNTINYTHHLDTRQEIVTDRLGHTTVNEYDTNGNVIQVTDAKGGVTTRTYDGRNNLLTETNPPGKTRTYTYDANNNRLTDTDPLSHTTTYTYNASNQVLSVTDALGRVTTNVYDAHGNLTSTTDALEKTTTYTYNGAGLRTSMTDPLGAITAYGYDAAGNLTQQTDALGHVTVFTYDGNGSRLTESKTQTTPNGPRAVLTQYQYDAQNRLTKTTFADGGTTQTVYNSIGKQATTIDQLGRQTTYVYDLMGRLTSTTYPDGTTESMTYDAEGNRLTITDRAGHPTAYTYDELKRLTQTTFADGALTSTTYDSGGQVTAVTDAGGHITGYAYDAAGRRASVTDALGHVTTFAYDAVGNQVSITDANGHLTLYQYDNANRRLKTIYSDTTNDTVVYDALGRTVSKTDQAGKTTQFQYDKLGRLTGVVDALSQTTSYTYDELGNRTSQTDANNHTTKFAYDALGRRLGRTLPIGMSEASTYNLVGNLATGTDFNGKTTTYAYDTLNRLISKTPDPTLGEATVRFSYTSTGQRKQMIDASGITTYAYDVRDRLVMKTTPQGTLTYAYDPAGNLASTRSSNANGTSVNYSYDQLNRLATVTDNRLTGLTTYAYDGVGNLASFRYSNGVSHTYAYNALNRLTGLAVVDQTSTALASYGYTLGAAGNRTAVTEVGGRRVDYTYDSLYRLTVETITGAIGGTTTYSYDPVGNRLGQSSPSVGLVTRTYDANDRLTTDAYDNDGNTVGSNVNQFTYDFENHLAGENNGAVRIVYDGDGNRVAKTVGGLTRQYLVDDRNQTGFAQVLEELSGGVVQRSYTYGLKRISQSQPSGVSFYGYDGHGSVRLLTDATGAATDRYDYDAFGNEIQPSQVTPNVYRYTGEEEDSDLALYNLRTRYYSAARGRFWTGDPFEGYVNAPSSLHRYVYAESNPVDSIDPSGKYSIGDVTATLALLSGSLFGSGGLSGGGGASGLWQRIASVEELYVRSFAPWKTFGGGFAGDNRGFTTTRDASVTSRITAIVEFQLSTLSILSSSAYSDPSRHPLLGTATGTPTISASTSDGKLHIVAAGSNPLVPGSPDIDVKLDLSVAANGGRACYSGSLYGDGFPNAEVFVVNSRNQATMLDSFGTSGGALTGPLIYLPGNNNRPMGNISTCTP